MLHKETVKKETFELLKQLMQDKKLSLFNLAGGTALALYLGHRISIDLDLFTPTSFDTKNLESHMIEKYGFKTAYIEKNTLQGTIKDIKVDCITHNYPAVEPPSSYENGIRLYSIYDIAAMKLSAIADNGSRLKDFIDIAYLSIKLSLKEMLQAYENKFPNSSSIIPLKGLTYFEDINLKEPIQMCKATFNWSPIKQRLYDTIKDADRIFPDFPITSAIT